VTEPITQDHTGKLMETFLAGYAEFENEVRKQRCTGGMQARLRAGIWCWSPPIGYVNSKKAKDRRKTTPDIPDEERFCLVQKGLRLYMEGNHSITTLAKESGKWGLRTRTGKPMRKQLWEEILTNKFYAGILVDPWTDEEFPGAHKAMITPEEFDLIERIKNGKSNAATARRLIWNPDFPLRRFVLCECGRPHTASWSKGRNRRYGFYHCKNRQCRYFGRSIAKDLVERKFCELLLKITPPANFLDFFKEIVVKTYRENHAAAKNEKGHRDRERAKLEMRRKELLEMRVNKEISQVEYKEMRDALDGQIANLALAENQSQGDFDIATAIDSAIDMIANIAVMWERADLWQKMRIQRTVLPKGVIFAKNYPECRTVILSPIFRLNQTFLINPSGLVAEVGHSWNQIVEDVKGLRAIVLEDVAAST
jgi:hypothetical protein